jgi:protein phosphatase
MWFYCGSVDGKQITMTEDHRITSYSERRRIEETGEPLKDGETRLCGNGKMTKFFVNC